jgi:tryptophan synthase alpha subunit
VANGAIVGSALVRLVTESAGKPRADMLAAVTSRVSDLASACSPAT